MAEARSILVVKLSSLGDTLHAPPAVAELRDRLPARVLSLADAVLTAGDAERAFVILTEERSAFADRAMRLHGLEPMEFAAVFLLEQAKEGGEAFCPPPELDYFQWIRSLLPA